MTNLFNHATKDFLIEVRKGNIEGHDIIHKFGHSENITQNAWSIISQGEVYQMPTSALSLELISGEAADNQAGVGARSLIVEGLDANYEFQSIIALTHATDGTNAVAISGTWTRVFRAYVLTSGAYATTTVYSHVGALTIRTASAGATWVSIPLEQGFAIGQSLIGAYSVPSGKTAYIGNIFLETETGKPVTVIGFLRQNIDIVTAPFSPIRTFSKFPGLDNGIDDAMNTWRDNLPEKTDLGFFARSTGATTQAVSIDFELLIVDNDI